MSTMFYDENERCYREITGLSGELQDLFSESTKEENINYFRSEQFLNLSPRNYADASYFLAFTKLLLKWEDDMNKVLQVRKKRCRLRNINQIMA